MQVEQAIRTALDFEKRVRDVYAAAAGKAHGAEAQSTLRTLADEEQQHVDFLEARLAEWTRTGALAPAQIDTALPAREKILAGLAGLKARMRLDDASRGDALALLRKAVEAEAEVGAFYRRMVDEVEAPARPMFARFLEIEAGHLAIVQAELDSVERLGYWFDVQEFRFEAE